ncbi:MAG: hypothetical protein JXR63_08010, partial [Spirochaetales bacterium]|nr:hypothetical protein [Spirochaetales bacterium]
FSCKNKDEFFASIELPGIDFQKAEIGWAVVVDDVVRVRELPSFDAKAISIIFKGSIVEFSEKNEEWIYINIEKTSGWINQSSISFFTSRSEALLFSKNISGSALAD